MPAEKKVSVGWQIVFTFLPIVGYWAFYRIRKLRRCLLYIVVPQVLLWLAIEPSTDYQVDYPSFGFDETTESFANYSNPVVILSTAGTIAVQGWAIYLVVIWSRQHNRQYDQPTVQPAS